MRTLNERYNDIVVIKNVSEVQQVIATKDAPRGLIIQAGQTARVSVIDFRTSLNNNKFIYGVDSIGTFAVLEILDDELKYLLGFENYDLKEDGSLGKCKNKQILLSKDIFVKMASSSSKDFKDMLSNLGGLTNGSKMMIAKILKDEVDKSLSSLSVSKLEKINKALSE